MAKYKKSVKPMIQEDMSAPSNLPRQVVNRQYGQCPEYDAMYDGSEHTMYMDMIDSVKKMNKNKSKNRY